MKKSPFFKGKRSRTKRRGFLALTVIAITVITICVSLFPNRGGNVSASVKGDGLITYGVGANTTPQSRLYTSSSNTFATAAGTVAGAEPKVMVTRTSPTKIEAVSGYVNSTGVLRIMCYNGSTWVNEWNVTVGGTGDTRRFDISYETSSGDVVVLYSTNTATTNELAYRTKAGSAACGSANWSGATNFNPARTSGIVVWVRVAWDKRSSSDLITATWADANSDLSTAVWSGSVWGNEPTAALANNLEISTSGQDVDDFDVEYESLSGDVMIVWGYSGAGTTNLIGYATCTGGTSSCTWSTPLGGSCTAGPPTALCVPTVADAATNIDIAANPLSNEIALGANDDNGASGDLSCAYWSGSAWTGTANIDTATENPLPGTRNVAVGWLVNGSTTRSIIAYNDLTTTNIGFVSGNGATFTLQTDQAPTPAFATPQDVYDIQMDPFNTDRLMMTVSDGAATSDLFAKRLIMNSAGTLTWSDANGGAALSTALSQGTVGDFSFAYWRAPPTFQQTAYQWWTNVNLVQPTPSLASLNTPITLTDKSIITRLRMALTNVGLDLATSSQKFNLQYATSTSGPWTSVRSPGNWCDSTTVCNQNWLSRRKLVFDNSAAAGNLSSFPVLVELSESDGTIDYSKTQGSGQDLRFLDPDGTVLAYDIETWNESGTSYVWVEVPQIDAGSKADYIWMYYDNASAAAGADMNGTWDNFFAAVWHMKEDPTPLGSPTGCNNTTKVICDSTATGANGDSFGTMTSADKVTGMIGDGIEFDGADDYISTIDINAMDGASRLTLTSWIKTNTSVDWPGIISKSNSSTSKVIMQIGGSGEGTNTGIDTAVSTPTSGSVAGYTSTGLISPGVWNQVTMVFDGTLSGNSNRLKVYINGVQQSLSFFGTIPAAAPSNASVVTLGWQNLGTDPEINGILDEMRISTTARNADWTKAEYLNSTNTFVSVGGEEPIGAVWKLYDNSTPVDGTTITTNLLTGSTIQETYNESVTTLLNPNPIVTNGVGEWDWPLDAQSACGGTYYFRMVKSDGTALAAYSVYPQITLDVAAPVDSVLRHGGWWRNDLKQPFSCEWVSG